MNLLRKLRSRSGKEIRFRLRQELTNLRLFAFPPHLGTRMGGADRGGAGIQPGTSTSSGHTALPNPAEVVNRLAPTPFAAECVRLADEILQHRFPLLGGVLETGPEIRWRRDYANGLETGLAYFRRIPYLDATRAGDHKNIWELSRHQHLVLLAQAHLFSGRQEFLEEIVRQLESWFEQNPFQRGINWASALEVAFRVLSWIWVDRLVGDRFSPAFRRRFCDGLYWHGLHLDANLSYYFSPNTHLLGEAVALHALGCLYPRFPGAKQWEKTGAEVVRNELDRQVLPDGCHFELSLYYHVYALDMFQFHAILRGLDDAYRDKLTRMAELLDAAIGSSGILPFIGDDDGGRFFHPYGPRNQFGLATLATCGVYLAHPDWIRNPGHLREQASWWLPGETDMGETDLSLSPAAEPVSARFPDCGLVVMAVNDIQLIVDAGPFGPGNAGHTHADTLGLVLRQGTEQILIDPGTYTYVGDPVWRNRFRGTAAHNTVRIDGLDQAIPGGPFAWQSRPAVEVLGWENSPARDVLTASCAYSGLCHRRTIVFDKSALWILVLDRLEGAGEHRIEQYWHFGTEVRQCAPGCFQAGSKVLVAFEEAAAPRLFEGGDAGWISPAFGVKSPAPVVLVERRATFPATLATLIDLSGKARSLRFRMNADHSTAECAYDDEGAACMSIPLQ